MLTRWLFALTPNPFYLELKSVIVGDGGYRMVYAINGSLPAPTLMVYEGQQVCLTKQNMVYKVVMGSHMYASCIII